MQQALGLFETELRTLPDHPDIIASDNAWVKLVPNTREASMHELTP
ncbi:MAG: aspartate-semialdehyde dehydrogenase, partial [Betaproteobacteria bacterium]|nr:aspartate-semialdehyde dehydrogenase [Betaproteobacteria bacterium]